MTPPPPDSPLTIPPDNAETEFFPKLPVELWVRIAECARNPIPLPLSKPPRCELRQPVLCALALASKDFQEIVKPLLYTHITTDNLTRLLREVLIPNPSPEKLALLRLTKSLRVEYADKTKPVDFTYERLLAFDHGGNKAKATRFWMDCAPSERDRRWRMLSNCKSELERTAEGMERSRESEKGKILPNLESISIASIYGPDPNMWQMWSRYNAKHGHPLPSLFIRCQDDFHQFLFTCGKLVSLCIRDPYGPLAIPKMPVGLPATPLSFTTISHFDYSAALLPLPVMRPSRWMYEGPADRDWAVVLAGLGKPFSFLRAARIPRVPINLSISCSTSRYSKSSFDAHQAIFPDIDDTHLNPPVAVNSPSLTLVDQRAWAAALQRAVTRVVGAHILTRAQISPDDKLEWRSAADSDPCQACGSRCPV